LHRDDLRKLSCASKSFRACCSAHRKGGGIFAVSHEQGEIGPDLFRKACEFGLEGLVSKRRDRPYSGGPVEALPAHPAYRRVQDQFG
jgi:hypothetical protein